MLSRVARRGKVFVSLGIAMRNQLPPAVVVAAAFAAAGIVRPAAAAEPAGEQPAVRYADEEHAKEHDEADESGDMEKPIKLADAPAAVRATVEKELAGGGKLKKLSKESEDGKTVYEAEIKDGKTEMSLNISADGKVLERETKIKKKDLPDGAMKAIKAKYPGAKVGAAEKVEKDGKTTYEVAVTPDGDDEAREITLDADGKIVKDEEAD